MAAINSYIGRTCTAPGAFKGLMGLLQGHYSDTLASAQTGMTAGAGIAEHCSSKISQTQSTYLDKDRQAYDRFAAKEKAAGRTVAPYKPPAGGGPLGPAANAYNRPDNYDPTGGLTKGGRYATENPYLAGAKGLGNVAKDGATSTAKDAWGLNKEKNRQSNPDWSDRTRAGLHNRREYKNGTGMDPDGGYRTPDYYSHNRQTQSGFDQGYMRGTRYAGDHVPDGTHYTGAADQDGHITQNRRPGSAWAGDGVTGAVHAGQVAHEAVTTGQDLYSAGTDFYDAYETNQDVHHLADGPSNTGSRDWASHDKGGTW